MDFAWLFKIIFILFYFLYIYPCKCFHNPKQSTNTQYRTTEIIKSLINSALLLPIVVGMSQITLQITLPKQKLLTPNNFAY